MTTVYIGKEKPFCTTVALSERETRNVEETITLAAFTEVYRQPGALVGHYKFIIYYKKCGEGCKELCSIKGKRRVISKRTWRHICPTKALQIYYVPHKKAGRAARNAYGQTRRATWDKYHKVTNLMILYISWHWVGLTNSFIEHKKWGGVVK